MEKEAEKRGEAVIGKKKFKSDLAVEAFSELCNNAGLERDRLLEDIARGEHSNYERAALRIAVSQAYQSMLADAYRAAMDIEHKAMLLHASVASAFGVQ